MKGELRTSNSELRTLNEEPSLARVALIALAPEMPRGFEPVMTVPRPAGKWQGYAKEDEEGEKLLDFADEETAEAACGSDCYQTGTLETEAWDAEKLAQAKLQWPWAWAELMLRAYATLEGGRK